MIEGTLRFTDESSLHFIEFVDVKAGMERYKYAYHYQDREENMIFRYDMAPHHPEIPTFPHHKHTPSNKVTACNPPALGQVLEEIDATIVPIFPKRIRRVLNGNRRCSAWNTNGSLFILPCSDSEIIL
jgi:hypothetical protein